MPNIDLTRSFECILDELCEMRDKQVTHLEARKMKKRIKCLLTKYRQQIYGLGLLREQQNIIRQMNAVYCDTHLVEDKLSSYSYITFAKDIQQSLSEVYFDMLRLSNYYSNQMSKY